MKFICLAQPKKKEGIIPIRKIIIHADDEQQAHEHMKRCYPTMKWTLWEDEGARV